MDCEEVKAQLSAYIDGEVAEKDAASIREHIAVCADCGQEELSLRKTSELLRYWDNVRAPDGFCEALLAKVESVSHLPRRSILNKLFEKKLDAVRPLAGPRALIKMAAYGAAVLLLCVGAIFLAKPPLRRAPMVEPLPTQAEYPLQKMDHTIQSFESSPVYTTMAEIKVAGIWK